MCDSCVDKQSELMSYLHELILMAVFTTTITIEGSVCYTNGRSDVIDGWTDGWMRSLDRLKYFVIDLYVNENESGKCSN